MLTREHATDRPHNAHVTQRFVVRGELEPDAFLDFVLDRAAWLDLQGWAGAAGEAVTVVAAGPEAMVGALEMALMLGPLDAVVHELDSFDEPGPVPPGFAIRH